jgi:signal transduction histidine kinase
MHSWTQAALEMNPAAGLDPEVRDALGRVLKAAERQESLLRGLENFARVTFSALSPEPADLDLAAERALSSLRATLERSGAKVMTEDPLGKVRADPNLLAEILISLISNAAKFTAPDKSAVITLRSEVRGPIRRLWIEDQGIGISSADQELLFRPFERLHPVDEYAGSGLGLVIADRAARRMDGLIGVESVADKGSRFWLDLPVA